MHVYLQFNGRFTPKADRIARILRDRHGFRRFSGLSTGEGHARWLLNPAHTDVPYHHVQPLPELWRAALARGRPDPGRLAQIEASHGNLWRFIIGDRNLGHTFLTGTIIPETVMRLRNERLDSVLSCLQELFDYFERRFEEDRPDGVFFQVVAAAPALVAGSVCRKMGIPFFTLGKTKYADRHHVAANVFMAPDAIVERYASPELRPSAEALQVVDDWSREPEPYDHFARDRENFRRRHGGPALGLALRQVAALPAALKRKRKPYPPDPRQATPFQMWRWETRVQWHYRRLMRSKIFSDQLPDGDFLYFALSVTPEASTCIEAPQYADQLVVIGALARGLPAGWRLVVKDHLPMCGRRTLEFYRCASQYPNVVMVNPTLSSPGIAARSTVTAVIAGTTGWEALFLGKPVVAFADAWFLATGLAQPCRNINAVWDDIRAAQLLAAGVPRAERHRRLARFVQAMIDGSFPFDYELMWNRLDPAQYETYRPNLEAAAAAFAARLEDVRRTGQVPDPFDTSPWNHDRTCAVDRETAS